MCGGYVPCREVIVRNWRGLGRFLQQKCDFREGEDFAGICGHKVLKLLKLGMSGNDEMISCGNFSGSGGVMVL